MRIALVPGIWSYGIGSASTVLSVREAALRSGDEPVVFSGPHFAPLLRRMDVAAVPLPGLPATDYPDQDDVLRLDDLLSRSVYTDSRFVTELIERQCGLLVEHRIDAVFHDYDVTSVVAGRLLGVPVVSPVTWPDHSGFGAGSSGFQPPARAATAAFGKALDRFGLTAPPDLSQLLFTWSTRLVFPLPPVLDPIVALHADGEYVGRLAWDALDRALPSGVADDWPRPGRVAVLAYSSGPPTDVPEYFARCVAAFDGTDVDVLITAGRVDPRWSDRSPAGNVRVAPLVPLRRLLDRADVLICHGGRNTLASAVEAEVPALVFAGTDPERGYFADMLARQGLGLNCADEDWSAPRLRALVRGAAGHRAAASRGPGSGTGGADRVVEVLHEVGRSDVLTNSGRFS
ncbi:glycosyltransferase [Micromonospora sp. NBC_00617]|uniref:glycosyltransferase n=1 Tax=Micromonospora sp. NBC_00617 TaxID=2903587 RepID=UPI0030E5B27B